MVLLPPLVYLGLPPSVPVVLALGVVALGRRRAVRAASRGRGCTSSRCRCSCSPCRSSCSRRARAEKPVDQYDAFANWIAEGEAPVSSTAAFSDASIAPPVHREYPLGLPSLEAYVLHAIGSANTRVAARALRRVPRRSGARRVDTCSGPHVADVAAGGRAEPRSSGCPPRATRRSPPTRTFRSRVSSSAPSCCSASEQLALGTVFAAAALATKRDAVAFCAVLYAVAFAALLVRRERDRLARAGRSRRSASRCRRCRGACSMRRTTCTTDDVTPSLAHADELGVRRGPDRRTLIVERAYLLGASARGRRGDRHARPRRATGSSRSARSRSASGSSPRSSSST